MKGYLITFEGVDMSGKTTALMSTANWLKERGVDVLTAREPGGTKLGEEVRAILHDTKNEMSSRTEALLYQAARAELVDRVITPALEGGKVVLLDRFFDSSMAYQGAGRGLGINYIKELSLFATSGLSPDLTLFFDIEPEIARERSERGHLNRMDLQASQFYLNTYAAFKLMIWNDQFAAEEEGKRPRWVEVDARQDINGVAKEVQQVIEGRLVEAGLMEGGYPGKERR